MPASDLQAGSNQMNITRVKQAVVLLGVLVLLPLVSYATEKTLLDVDALNQLRANDATAAADPTPMTLAPAQWIWMPSDRTLSNTFALFRKEIELKEAPVRALGWVTADSRYRLSVNGQRVQWGPAPCDPRQLDVDPCDLTALFKPARM
jgi:hypothetical protein